MPTFANPAAQSLYQHIIDTPQLCDVVKEIIAANVTTDVHGTFEDDTIGATYTLPPQRIVPALREYFPSVGIAVEELDDAAIVEVAAGVAELLRTMTVVEVLTCADGAESDSENG